MFIICAILVSPVAVYIICHYVLRHLDHMLDITIVYFPEFQHCLFLFSSTILLVYLSPHTYPPTPIALSHAQENRCKEECLEHTQTDTYIQYICDACSSPAFSSPIRDLQPKHAEHFLMLSQLQRLQIEEQIQPVIHVKVRVGELSKKHQLPDATSGLYSSTRFQNEQLSELQVKSSIVLVLICCLRNIMQFNDIDIACIHI